MTKQFETLEELEEKKPLTISVPTAAKIMGVTPKFLQVALAEDKFPFGTGIKLEQMAFYINCEKFIKYMRT